ncbi:MAG: oxidoreductase [Candidatus Cloacimonetes bacterium]|nr:oxidoreductase [Candidatus Cloacimonadota bacterium]
MPSKPKPKVAFYWCASCGGCEEAIIDLEFDLLKVVEAVEIVFWPCAMDFKTEAVRKMEDGEIAIAFINGAVRTSEQLEMCELLRRKAQIIIAFGACAQVGGIPGLANFWDKETIFRSSYLDKCPSTDNPGKVVPLPKSKVPEGELELPVFFNTVKTLDDVIDVDYYLPGCSPAPYLTLNAINTLLSGDLPPKGSVLAPNKALCETCTRNDSKPENLSLEKIYRVSQIEVDPEKCLLAQGIICMGPVTRSGCTPEGEGRCVLANMPCRGCYGPTPEVRDVGAKMIAALASLVGLEGEEEMTEEQVTKLMDSIVDPGGTFYRFTLAKSLLKRRRMPSEPQE